MAAAVASSHMPQLGKMKRPPSQLIQTSAGSSRPNNLSPSPSSATKRLPNSASAISNAPNGIARPTRRPQRVQTRITDGGPGAERRTTLKDPEPYGTTNTTPYTRLPCTDRENSPKRVIHPEEVQGKPAFPRCSPPCDSLPIRPARWKL
jgi:hypothetical protein